MEGEGGSQVSETSPKTLQVERYWLPELQQFHSLDLDGGKMVMDFKCWKSNEEETTSALSHSGCCNKIPQTG